MGRFIGCRYDLVNISTPRPRRRSGINGSSGQKGSQRLNSSDHFGDKRISETGLYQKCPVADAVIAKEIENRPQHFFKTLILVVIDILKKSLSRAFPHATILKEKARKPVQ